MKLIVAEGRQINLEGKLHRSGETVNLDAQTAAPLLVRGIVSEAQEAPKKGRKNT